MQDFETHPAGTADLVKHLRGGLVMQSVGLRAADRIEELETALAAVGNASAHRITDLETALTRANAATAATYEVAARAVAEAHVFAENDTDGETAAKVIALGRAGKSIRALATPDQTAALDKLIAEAESRVWGKAAEIAHDYTPEKHSGATLASHITGRSIEAAILAASKKGGV